MGFIFRLLRNFPPIVWFGLAPVLAILAGVIWYNDNQHNAALAKQLSAAPPALAALETLKPDANAELQEVNVLAQIDLEHTSEMVETKDGREVGVTTFAPLYPETAKDTSKPAAAVMLVRGKISEDQIMKMVDQTKPGTFGPIIKLNGMVTTDIYDFTKSEQTLRGAANLAANPVFIEPFLEGRKTGLKASSLGKVALGFGLVLAALCLLFGWLRMREVGGLRY